MNFINARNSILLIAKINCPGMADEIKALLSIMTEKSAANIAEILRLRMENERLQTISQS